MFLHTNRLSSKPPVSCCAHQLFFLTMSFSLLDLAASVEALLTLTRPLTLASCVTGASVELVNNNAAFSPFPKCLVAAELGISALPRSSFAGEFAALISDPVMSAPVTHKEAVAFATIYHLIQICLSGS